MNLHTLCWKSLFFKWEICATIKLVKKIKLNNFQLKVLVDIGILAGQLAAASMVLPFMIPGLDQTKLAVVLLGLLLTFGLWSVSILVAGRIKR